MKRSEGEKERIGMVQKIGSQEEEERREEKEWRRKRRFEGVGRGGKGKEGRR